MVAFDQRRLRPDPLQSQSIEFPNGLGDRAAVAVDEQRIAGSIAVLGETGEMDFSRRRQRQRRDDGARVAPVIDAGNVDVIDVKQQSAAGASNDLADEFGLAERRRRKFDVGRRVFEQDSPLQALLGTVDVSANPVECFAVVGQR